MLTPRPSLLWVFLALLLGGGAFSPVLAASKKPAMVYYRNVFDNELTAQQSTLDSIANSGEGVKYYNMNYGLDATISMYEATKNTRYLERALTWAEMMISKATIIDKDGYANWRGDWQSPYSATPISLELNEIKGAVELSRLARLILKTKELDAIYGKRAGKVYNFVKRNIVEKIICTRASIPYPPKDSPFNDKNAELMRMMQDIVDIEPGAYCRVMNERTLYAQPPGKPAPQVLRYAHLLRVWAKEFKSRFSLFDGTLIWDKGLSWYDRGYTAIDTSHANRYPYMVVYLYKGSTVFTLRDIKGMADLFTKVIWNGSYADPMFANFIDGSNQTFYNYSASKPTSSIPRLPWGDGLIYDGWVNLGEYDPQVQKIGDTVLRAIMAGKHNPSLDYNNTFWGRMELAAHLAKNLSHSSSAGATKH